MHFHFKIFRNGLNAGIKDFGYLVWWLNIFSINHKYNLTLMGSFYVSMFKACQERMKIVFTPSVIMK